MIISEKETTVAYRCPHCGTGIMSVVGIFSLSGDLIKLKCSCGHSELTITYTSDGKIRLNVPCIICPKPHNFIISSTMFFSKDMFRISCTYTGIDICFIGSKESVIEALKQADEELSGMLQEAGVDSLSSFHDHEVSDFIDDPTIEEILRFMLVELQDEGNIHCNCGEDDIPEYKFEFVPPEYDTVRIYCTNCNAEKTIPMTSVINANAFLHCDELLLT